MNIVKERKLFERYARSKNYSLISATVDDNFSYLNKVTHIAWEAWLASRNREGYVFVPIEPTEDVLLLMCDEVSADFKDMENAYKAMIGACDD